MSFLAVEQGIHDDPRFADVALGVCNGILDFYARHREARRLLADQGQMRVATICLYLDPHITLSGVQKLVPANIASPNRVAAMLKHLEREGGLVTAAARDGRMRVLRLAPAFERVLELWVREIVRHSLPWVPEPRPDLDDRRHYAIWCGEFVRATTAPARSLKPGAPVERGLALRGGNLIHFEVMRRVFDPEQARIPFSKRAFAARYELSRTHLIDLLAEAERQGWFRFEHGLLVPSETAVAGGRKWLAKFLAIGAKTLQGAFIQSLANGDAASDRPRPAPAGPRRSSGFRSSRPDAAHADQAAGSIPLAASIGRSSSSCRTIATASSNPEPQ